MKLGRTIKQDTKIRKGRVRRDVSQLLRNEVTSLEHVEKYKEEI